MFPALFRILGLLILVYLLVGVGVFFVQRSLLYHPTHRAVESIMEPWVEDGIYVGYHREVPQPRGVWLILHGNGGQAAHRDYLLEQLDPTTSVYVVEYPGYGDRPGTTTEATINQAAREAYQQVRIRHPHLPIGVLGESIGSGPASLLAQESPSPAKIVLLVPFDELYRVAASRFPWLPVKWLMRDQWDNTSALRDYTGPIEIYATRDDEIIPFERAQTLAKALPQARLIEIPGGHNSWIYDGKFELPTRPRLAAPE
ncbi:MAG: hypothetical protein SynsKO_03350 [Synoicihabitans sp.]